MHGDFQGIKICKKKKSYCRPSKALSMSGRQYVIGACLSHFTGSVGLKVLKKRELSPLHNFLGLKYF